MLQPNNLAYISIIEFSFDGWLTHGVTPLPKMFHLYRGGQFYWWRKPGIPGPNHRPVSSH